MDLHAQYTASKGYMRIAFIELLKEKTFQEITISDIAVKAGYIRQTFYMYYQSKNALLEEIVLDLSTGLLALMEKAYENGFETLLEQLVDNYHPLFLEYFLYMRKYKDEFEILLNPSNGTNFHTRFSKAMIPFQRKNMESWQRLNGETGDNTVQILYSTAFGSFLTGLLGWISGGMVPDEKKMAIYHTQAWISYIFLLKDIQPNYIYQKLIDKMIQRGIPLPEEE